MREMLRYKHDIDFTQTRVANANKYPVDRYSQISIRNSVGVYAVINRSRYDNSGEGHAQVTFPWQCGNTYFNCCCEMKCQTNLLSFYAEQHISSCGTRTLTPPVASINDYVKVRLLCFTYYEVEDAIARIV